MNICLDRSWRADIPFYKSLVATLASCLVGQVEPTAIGMRAECVRTQRALAGLGSPRHRQSSRPCGAEPHGSQTSCFRVRVATVFIKYVRVGTHNHCLAQKLGAGYPSALTCDQTRQTEHQQLAKAEANNIRHPHSPGV